MDTKRKELYARVQTQSGAGKHAAGTPCKKKCVRNFGISSSMPHRWRKEFQANAANVFYDKPRSQAEEPNLKDNEPGDLLTI